MLEMHGSWLIATIDLYTPEVAATIIAAYLCSTLAVIMYQLGAPKPYTLIPNPETLDPNP